MNWGDISIAPKDGGEYLPIRIKKLKAGISRDVVLRPFVATDSVVFHVKTFLGRGGDSFQSGLARSAIFGANLRNRMPGIMEISATANGVFNKRMDARSSRPVGDTALYTQWAPLDVIQRWGRWGPLTSHQYQLRDATALNELAIASEQSTGLLAVLD